MRRSLLLDAKPDLQRPNNCVWNTSSRLWRWHRSYSRSIRCPLPMADGCRFGHTGQSVSSSDEDDCIRRLYAWAENHDSSASDATENDDEEQETPMTTTTADHQVVDEEKKRWRRRFAK